MTGGALVSAALGRLRNQRQGPVGQQILRERQSARLACPLHCIRRLAPPALTVAVPLDRYGCVSLEGDYPLKA
jgi:hypothetical protein